MENSDWTALRLESLEAAAGWRPDPKAALRSLRQRERRRTLAFRFAVAAGFCVAGLMLSFPATRAFAARCVDACIAPFSKPGENVALRDIEGRIVRLEDFRGKTVLVNFWATWCPPCKKEIPDLEALQSRYAAQGLVVLGISMDGDGLRSVEPFLKANPVNYRVLVDGEAAAASFGGIQSLPATLLLDKSGNVTWRRNGVLQKEEAGAELQKLLTAR